HDAVGDRQPQPGAAADRLAGVERIEDARQYVGGNAAAAVGDADPGLAVLGAGGDDDGAAVLDRLAGVDQQVHEHLVDLRQMAFDRRQLAVELLDPDLVLEVVPDDVEGRLHALVQVRGPHLVAAADVGNLLEVLHDLGDALDALTRFVQQLGQVAGDEVDVQALAPGADVLAQFRRGRLQGHVLVFDQGQQGADVFVKRAQVGVHVAERIVDLVRHAGGEQADRGHLLRLQQLLAGPGQAQVRGLQFVMALLQLGLARPALGDVVEDHQVQVDVVAAAHHDLQDHARGHGDLPRPAAAGTGLVPGAGGQQAEQVLR